MRLGREVGRGTRLRRRSRDRSVGSIVLSVPADLSRLRDPPGTRRFSLVDKRFGRPMLSARAYSFRQKSKLAISLSWVGGYTNVVLFLACGTFSSHMTGNATR